MDFQRPPEFLDLPRKDQAAITLSAMKDPEYFIPWIVQIAGFAGLIIFLADEPSQGFLIIAYAAVSILTIRSWNKKVIKKHLAKFLEVRRLA